MQFFFKKGIKKSKKYKFLYNKTIRYRYKKYPKIFGTYAECEYIFKKFSKLSVVHRCVCANRKRFVLYIAEQMFSRNIEGEIIYNYRKKAWQRKNVGDYFIHYYCGLENQQSFLNKKDSIYDYRNEWNIFIIKKEDKWYVRYTHYNITFGDILEFDSKRDAIFHTKKIRRENSKGLSHLKEYKPYILFDEDYDDED